MRPYDSLRQKLVQPFLLLGFIVSASLSLITFALLAQIEERAIARTLHVELESFRNRYALNRQAIPAESKLLEGVFLPDPRLRKTPEIPVEGEVIEIRSVEDGDFSVLYAQVGGRPFALLYDRSYIKSNLENIAFLLLVATAAMTFISFLIGYQLSRRVVQPIVRLLHEVSTQAERLDLPAEPAGFADAGYPADEIGDLVQAMDKFSARLYEFVRREGYFASDVSHELRTPVAVISGAAEVLSELPDLAPAVRRRIATIHRNALRMSQVLEAMLLLAKEERLDADPICNVDEVIHEVMADCQPALEGKPVLLEADMPVSVSLPVERALIYVLISNVIRNACAYTREGKITIVLSERELKVRDTGIGIPEERFMEMFRRHAKGEESAGHGLGLSIVARICERLRWKISVESTAGQGTSFNFSFPT